MMKLNRLGWVLIAVVVMGCMMSSIASAADKVVVIPLFKKGTSCSSPDEVVSEGQCWKDRNLGATQAATSSTDSLAFGDLYQWGRLSDGHQNRNSLTTNVVSQNDVPGHSSFIINSNDWRSPRNDNLWQGLGGVNNPCPQGFRVPTQTELETERASWTSNNAAGALASPLRSTLAGFRTIGGVLADPPSSGSFWSSTINGNTSMILEFGSSSVYFFNVSRAEGNSIRCIKD